MLYTALWPGWCHAIHCTLQTMLGQWEGQWSVLLIAAARLRECFSAPLLPPPWHLSKNKYVPYWHSAALHLKKISANKYLASHENMIRVSTYRNLGIIMLSSSSASLASCAWLGLPFFRTGLSDRWMAVAATIPWPPMPPGGPMGGRLDPRGPYTTKH